MKKIFLVLAMLFLFGVYTNINANEMPANIPALSLNQGQSINQNNIQIPSYKQVCKYLKDIPDWDAEECSGSNIDSSSMGGKFVNAERSYSKNGKNVTVSVVSGMGAIATWAPFSQGLSVETDESIIKVIELKGYKAGVNYNKKEHNGSIVIPLLKAKKLNKTPAVAILGASYENMDYTEALDFIKKFNLDSLEALFQK